MAVKCEFNAIEMIKILSKFINIPDSENYEQNSHARDAQSIAGEVKLDEACCPQIIW